MTPRRSPLHRVLSRNALFSATSGTLFLVASAPLARWIGLGDRTPLLILGALLLAFAGHLMWASRRPIPRLEALYFVLSDWLWVAGTLVLLLAYPGSLSVAGRVLAIAIALVVGRFAWLQSRALGSAQA